MNMLALSEPAASLPLDQLQSPKCPPERDYPLYGRTSKGKLVPTVLNSPSTNGLVLNLFQAISGSCVNDHKLSNPQIPFTDPLTRHRSEYEFPDQNKQGDLEFHESELVSYAAPGSIDKSHDVWPDPWTALRETRTDSSVRIGGLGR